MFGAQVIRSFRRSCPLIRLAVIFLHTSFDAIVHSRDWVKRCSDASTSDFGWWSAHFELKARHYDTVFRSKFYTYLKTRNSRLSFGMKIDRFLSGLCEHRLWDYLLRGTQNLSSASDSISWFASQRNYVSAENRKVCISPYFTSKQREANKCLSDALKNRSIMG